MSIAILLVLLATGALILPSFGDDSDDDDDDKNKVEGTFEDDELEGTEGNDLIRGFTGEDTIRGLGGNDEIRGGDGVDTIFGGDGLDFIRGGEGNDIISGGEGNDRIISDRGDDEVDAGYGSDVVRGGLGNDTIFGGFDARLQPDGSLQKVGQSFDQLSGEDGDDTIFIWGGGNDAGGGGQMNGGIGDDTLVLVTGQTNIDPGAGSNGIYAFANVEDDDITLGIIDEFDPRPGVGDTLVLTVDGILGATDPTPDVTFDTTETTMDENGVTVPGVLIEARIADGSVTPAESEGASVFIRGATIDSLAGAEIEVVFTNGADYFDGQGTLDAVRR